MKKISLLFILIFLISCAKDSEREKEIAAVDVDFIIERFDKAFFEADSTSLPQLKKAYPFMFSNRYDDSFWVEKMKDSLQQELGLEVQKEFSNLKEIKNDIDQLFQHLKYYQPQFNIPRVITVTSSVDYRNKVIVTDTIVLVSIDTYLGSDHKFYQGIQKYLRQNFNKGQVVCDLASAYAERDIFQQNNTLLDEMIYFGKQLYFKDIMIPFKSDFEKIGYSKEHLDWAISNESQIWTYFVEREMLFSTDPKLINRFIAPAPFSKFQLVEIDNESPGRIGQYLGWQIVRAYMKNNKVSFQQMLSKSAEQIFNEAKFKPLK